MRVSVCADCAVLTVLAGGESRPRGGAGAEASSRGDELQPRSRGDALSDSWLGGGEPIPLCIDAAVHAARAGGLPFRRCQRLAAWNWLPHESCSLEGAPCSAATKQKRRYCCAKHICGCQPCAGGGSFSTMQQSSFGPGGGYSKSTTTRRGPGGVRRTFTTDQQ